MKRTVLFLLLVGSVSFQSFPQGSVAERKDLYDLLDLRRKKFEAYSGSLEKKSGFFGNKTKKDIQHSTDVLMEIVETDNRIISSLNHVIDFRNFQKVNTNYDQLKSDEHLNNLEHATDTLTKQVDALMQTNAVLKSKTGRMKWLVYILSFLIAAMLVSSWRKKFLTR